MPHPSVKLNPPYRRWLHGTFGVLFFTGLGWWLLQRYGRVEGDFGPQAHPLAPSIMKLHGAAAMISLLVLGALIPLHLHRGWQARRNRTSGGFMVVLCALLIVTGYALYYAGGETLRAWSGTLHVLLGLGFPAALLWHIKRGRRSAPRSR